MAEVVVIAAAVIPPMDRFVGMGYAHLLGPAIAVVLRVIHVRLV